MDLLHLRVIFPGQLALTITLNKFEIPSALLKVGPPVYATVAYIHKGCCLRPVISLAAQGVLDGDVIVVHPTADPMSSSHGRFASFPARSGSARANGTFNELLRLADSAFAPYEASSRGAGMYRDMLAEMLENETPEPKSGPGTVLSESPGEIPTARLPVCWDETKRRQKSHYRSPPV
jgi:hypothetical protein